MMENISAIFNFTNNTNNFKQLRNSNVSEFKATDSHIWILFPPILLLLGTVGNALTIIIYLRTPLRNTAIAVYAIALAISDTVALYIGLLQTWIIVIFGQGFPASSFICKINTWMTFTSLQVSTWIISALTIERVVVVWFPFRYRKKVEGTKHAVIIVSLITLFITLLNSHFLYGMKNTGANQEVRFERSCTGVTQGYMYFVQHIWPFIDTAVYFFVPSIIIIFGNVLLLYKVTKSGKLSKGQQLSSTVSQEPSRLNRGRRSLLPIVITLNMVFLATTSPISVFQLVNNLNEFVITDEQSLNTDKATTIWTILYMVMNINHSVNCFIYVITGSAFRREIMLLLCGQCRSSFNM